MYRRIITLSVILSAAINPYITFSQKANTGIDRIKADDLEAYVSFLASASMKGRFNGSQELEITLNFLSSQAKLIGLKPGNGSSYLQPYTLIKKSIDQEKSEMMVFNEMKDSVSLNEPVYQLFPVGASDFKIDGELLFAGYGIKADKYGYNDLENISAEGKILLIMTRAPLSEDGTRLLFTEPMWSTFMNIQAKLTNLIFSKAKAILIVPDPKSGVGSIDKLYPGIAEEISARKYLKGSKPLMTEMPGMPKVIFINRTVADEILKGTGQSLEELQKKIDTDMKSHSFLLQGKRIRITEVSKTDEVIMNNVAAWIEGSDPVLKKEIIIFSGHADHIGGEGDNVKPGADDDASGCAAILELAQAFAGLQKKPLRSLLFLWVTGEEIGLFGSSYYINNPLFPLENTVADLNMDMIGRVKGVADSTDKTPMTGKSGLFVITDYQSKELVSIANDVDKKYPIDFDYSLSGRNHPLQLFTRSDHYNFVRKDIPVLFFTTGLHSDYHKTGDVIGKIDFKKMELITKAVFEIGFTVANQKNRLVVDNPYSKW